MATPFNPENMEIGVLEPIWVHDHIEYEVCIWFSAYRDTPLSSVYRRFSVIYQVLKRLVEVGSDRPLPPLPAKRFFGALDPSFIEQRRKKLEIFLKAVCKDRFLIKDVAFLKLVGFPVAKAALTLEIGRDNQVTSPSEAISIPWLLNDMPSVDEERMLFAARQLLRSTPYILIRVLPPISFKSSHRVRALVKDAEKEYILTVIQIHPKRGVKFGEGKKGDRVCRLLERPLISFIFTPTNVYTDGICLYIVRKVISTGSVRDRAYGARWFDKSTVKYSSVGKPYSVDYIAFVVKQVVLMCSALHAANVPCPYVHLGKCYDVDGQIVFSGLENVLSGTTLYPPVLVTTTQTHTHIDILLIGVLTLEMALGTPLSTRREVDLTVMYRDPTGTIGTDNDLRVHLLTKLLHNIPRTIPSEVASFARAVFDPTRKVEPTDLFSHPLLSKANLSYKHRGCRMKDHVAPLVELKRKEIEIFYEVAKASMDHVKQATIKVCRKERSRLLLKKIRQRGSSYSSSGVACSSGFLSLSCGSMMNEPLEAAPPPSSSLTETTLSALLDDHNLPKQLKEGFSPDQAVPVSSCIHFLPPPPPPRPGEGQPPPPPLPPPPHA